MVFEVERHADGGLGDLCRSVLGELGEWFGIPESNADYIEQAEEHPGVVVRAADQAIGLTTLVHHGPEAAEVYLMAVRRASHRTGAGTAMLAEVERWLAEQGVGFLQVKTLSASRPDENYIFRWRCGRGCAVGAWARVCGRDLSVAVWTRESGPVRGRGCAGAIFRWRCARGCQV